MWEIPENATVRLPRGRRPTLVRVERGTVLVTRAGDHEDHVLGPGDELLLPPRGLAVAWALTEAGMEVSDAAPAPRRSRAGWRRRPATH
jgi:hypothetical protein